LSDTSPRDQAALRFDAIRAAARTPRPDEEVWRLSHAVRIRAAGADEARRPREERQAEIKVAVKGKGYQR